MTQMIKNCWNCNAELGSDFTWCPYCQAQMNAAPSGWKPNVRPGNPPQATPMASSPAQMGTKTCWKCKNEVQNTRSSCPFCHAKVGQRDLTTGMAHNTTYWTPTNIIKNIIGGGCLLLFLPFACPVVLRELRTNPEDRRPEGVVESTDQRQRREAREPHPVVSKAQYDLIKPRMSYEQVVAIIGSQGEEMSRNELAGYTTVMYSWANADGTNMNAMFQNNRLVQKAQFRLP